MFRLATLLLLSALPAAAAPVAFSTARAFRAEAGATFTETFNRCGRATAVFSGPLSAAGNEACAAGAIRPGISFSDDPGPFGHQLYLAAPGYAANRTAALGQNDPATDALHIRFDAPSARSASACSRMLAAAHRSPARSPSPSPCSTQPTPRSPASKCQSAPAAPSSALSMRTGASRAPASTTRSPTI